MTVKVNQIFVLQDEVISDSECYDLEHDEPEKQLYQK